MLHPSLPLGPNTSYVNNTVLRGALVGRRGPTQKYCTFKVPFSRPSLGNSPRSLQTARPPRRGGSPCAAARGPEAAARRPDGHMARSRATAAALCFDRPGVSHRPPPSQSRTNPGAKAAANVTAGAATEAAATSLSSSSSSSSATATATRGRRLRLRLRPRLLPPPSPLLLHPRT